MKKERRNVFKRIASLSLAIVMMFTVIGVMPQKVSAADYTIQGKGTQVVTITDEECYGASGQDAYIMFKPKATGSVTIKATNVSALTNETYGGITLCNAAKQELSESDERYYTNYTDSLYYTMTYGVKKNTTYYLRVRAVGGTQITATFKKVNDKGAVKRTKANTISKGKSIQGVIVAGEKKADWYKIKLTKSQKVKLSYSANTNGSSAYSGIKVTFCKSNGQKFVSNADGHVSRSNPKNGITFYRQYSISKKITGIAPGTYYVKVEPYTKTSSGLYTIKWK